MASQAQQAMLDKLKTQTGFIAALDQSGGSTPKALRLYGIEESEYSSDEEMFNLVHEMRTRIITSTPFSGERVLGAILFENTLDREIEESNGVQVMKPMPGLDALLAKAVAQDVFGTKMRSVVKLANHQGIKDVVAQQFEVGKQILAAGLVPIIEPEVDIHSPQKAEAEALLKLEILTQLNLLNEGQEVMLKLTLPTEANFYKELVDHPRVLKVVALSGGYSREEANAKLAENQGMIASFSRALTEGVSAKQSQEEFEATLNKAIEDIYQASKA